MSKYHQLTQEERYRITAHRMAGCTQAEIARLLQRHPSTISRGLRRNVTRHDGDYRAEGPVSTRSYVAFSGASGARTGSAA